MSNKKVKGCVHVHIRGGKVINAFSHLSNFPDNCIIHLKPDEVLSLKEFEKSHSIDKDEVYAKEDQKVFDLGDSSYKKT